jgi:hypothetical protein
MGMAFPQPVREEAMVACERHCCICHEFKGTKIECQYIVPEAKGGTNTFENCIPLCFDHHAEVESYNPQHPRGTKYSVTELKKLRDAWYEEIKNRRTLRDPKRLGNAPIQLDSFEEARSIAENPANPRNRRLGVVKAWELLARGILKMTNVSSVIFEPFAREVQRALEKLWDSTRVPEELTRSISPLQWDANRAALHSEFAGYDPDINAALAFIEECERVRDELVKIYNSGGL